MAGDLSGESKLFRAVSDVVGDLAKLVRSELKLAKAEISSSLTAKLRTGAWMGAAATLALLAVIFMLQGVVFALIAAGMQPYTAALLVAIVLALAAGGAFYKGRADWQQGLTPDRAVHQIREDFRMVKEQVT